MIEPDRIKAAENCIRDADDLRSKSSIERPIINNLISYLRQMFPGSPVWVTSHIKDAESLVQYRESQKTRRAFIDNLVGYTAIEYEKDLRQGALFTKGRSQVDEQVAGLLNQGKPVDKIRGVLSDTLEWRVYRIKTIRGLALRLGPSDIDLEEIDKLDISGGGQVAAEQLIDFLERHLGRVDGQPLDATTVARELGFTSHFNAVHLPSFQQMVRNAFSARPDYADIIRNLWSEFAGYTGAKPGLFFDEEMFVNELYAVTLAKLLCANVVASKALHSSTDELGEILNGMFFKRCGLSNLVEYDYFGWLSEDSALIPIAEAMQRGLRSFDFSAPASEDLFSGLLVQLADRYQRLLLGQEATPPWLARSMAQELFARLPVDEAPRFVDMCCGSGSMLVEVLKLTVARLAASGADPSTWLAELAHAATGFDIDPLAVMLAKVNWVLAVRSHLTALDPNEPIAIPIYHADSMFAKTLVSTALASANDPYRLVLGPHSLNFPAFLVTAELRTVFDQLLATAYPMSMEVAKLPMGTVIPSADIDAGVDVVLAAAEPGVMLDMAQAQELRQVFERLIEVLAELQRSALNGVWAFVLRNGYRPGLVQGQFNGLITNPPWLTLSRISDNPYERTLKAAMAAYGVKPRGNSHLHADLAPTFLLHAISHYLVDGAVVACILPESILNGKHHEQFRQAKYGTAPVPVSLKIDEVWRIDSGTFKNEGVVLVGEKKCAGPPSTIPGHVAKRSGARPPLTFKTITLGTNQTSWDDSGSRSVAGTAESLPFRQGADLMPRTGVFVEATPASNGNIRISPIDPVSGPNRYLVNDAKKLKAFRISPATVPETLIYDALISKHLVPFDLAAPAKALLPFERSPAGKWTKISPVRLAASPVAASAFKQVCDAWSASEGHLDLAGLQERINKLNKLTSQKQAGASDYLVVAGAGGGPPAAAYAPVSRFNPNRLVIDQTLYGMVVASEAEAIYYSAIFNSHALEARIEAFQPQGAFGRRHVHTLPMQVTPSFHANDPDHQAVVTAARALIAEFAAMRGDPAHASLFDANTALNKRRAKIRELVAQLAAYGAYAAACARALA